MSEKSILNKIQLLASELGQRLFRNNNGMALVHGQPLKYGLGKGTGDLIGWSTIVITPDLLGKRVAVFTNYEAKFGKTRTSPEQQKFHKTVIDAGGISLIETFPDTDISKSKLAYTITTYSGAP